MHRLRCLSTYYYCRSLSSSLGLFSYNCGNFISLKQGLQLFIKSHSHSPSVIYRYQKTDFSKTSTQLLMGEKFSTGNKPTFVGWTDRHKGVHIESIKEPCDTTNFSSKLEDSLKQWMSQEVQAVWFSVNLKHSDWVPILANNGFRFHHTEGDEVAMVRWLGADESRIPVFAHTMIGAGAVVINKEGKLLVVQETYQKKPFWKLPGGYVEPGEDIPQAAMREVMEETNIKTEFRSMIAFRHSHTAQFGCSDIYFIVELTPLTADIVKDNHEIEDCQWMEIETYLNHPDVHENNRMFLRKYLFSKESGVSINGEKALHPVTKAPQMLFALGKRK